MSRTTPSAVQDILLGNYDPKNPLTGFILTANALVNQLVTLAAARRKNLDTTTQERVECFLAAHFYQHADQGFQSKTTGKASAQFKGQSGLNLDSTDYGQTAMLLDTTRVLAAMNKGGIGVGIQWIGKTKSSQIDYTNRN